jgi:hypothetical protein
VTCPRTTDGSAWSGKVLVGKLDAQLLEVQKQGQMMGFGVALTMAGRCHRRNERSTTTDLLYSQDIARLIRDLRVCGVP